MQKLPYVVVTNPHMSLVYDLYFKAFETLRKVPEIKTAEDNDKFCRLVKNALREHLTVIPNLAMGVLECRDLIAAPEMDKFMNKMLRSVRIIGPRYSASVTNMKHREYPDVLLQNNI